MIDPTTTHPFPSQNGHTAITDAPPQPTFTRASERNERVETLIIGAGQSGLSIGYQLMRLGRPHVILDANERIGDAWRRRWDSLRLFTPAKFNSLAGMDFPADPNYFPTKDEMADFLEEYARRFNLPVRSAIRVERLWKENGRYV